MIWGPVNQLFAPLPSALRRRGVSFCNQSGDMPHTDLEFGRGFFHGPKRHLPRTCKLRVLEHGRRCNTNTPAVSAADNPWIAMQLDHLVNLVFCDLQPLHVMRHREPMLFAQFANGVGAQPGSRNDLVVFTARIEHLQRQLVFGLTHQLTVGHEPPVNIPIGAVIKHAGNCFPIHLEGFTQLRLRKHLKLMQAADHLHVTIMQLAIKGT